MPRLVNIGAGEIVDRLTILALKILYAGQQSKPADHFEQERNALLTQLRGRTTMNGMWFEHALTLGAVNGALWQTEDKIREIRSHDPNSGLMESAGQIGCRIQELNDQRARLIETINKLTGDHLGAEKL
jgi:hypothetical protein